jgi:hypothetical protein
MRAKIEKRTMERQLLRMIKGTVKRRKGFEFLESDE